jgi:hypothetical protein
VRSWKIPKGVHLNIKKIQSSIDTRITLMRRMTKRRTPLGVMTVVLLGWGESKRRRRIRENLRKLMGVHKMRRNMG